MNDLKCNFHCHTAYCDGKNTPEEMVQAAIELGMTAIGFSGHSHTAFDESYCMMPGDIEEYAACISSLQEKYAGQIEIYCGIEQDLYSDTDTSEFDYSIGSVHYVKLEGAAPGNADHTKDGSNEGLLTYGEDVYLPMDESAEITMAGVNRYFGGDVYALAEVYFEQASRVAEKTGCDIIGHFDLLTKFNQDGNMFDESDERYVNAYTAAIERLVKSGVPFEINTGAMSRGYRSEPYPAETILKEIRRQGGRIAISSDSHSTDTQLAYFDEAVALAKSVGFKTAAVLTSRGFKYVEI